MVSRDTPRVSIIIPCYNQGHYLRRSVTSALAQSGVLPEVIVVNDGSTDETAAVLQSFPDVIAIHQTNQGLAAARNAGMARATGEFVSFLDADDWLDPDFTATLIASCIANDCEFSFCDFYRVDADGQVVGTREYGFHWPVPQNILSHLMQGGLFPPACVVGRRVAFKPFPGGMDGHADYAVWLDVTLSGSRFAHVPQPLMFYRHTPDSMSADRMHMELSWQAALAYNAARHPERFFAAIQSLQKREHALTLLLKNEETPTVTFVERVGNKIPRVRRLARAGLALLRKHT